LFFRIFIAYFSKTSHSCVDFTSSNQLQQPQLKSENMQENIS